MRTRWEAIATRGDPDTIMGPGEVAERALGLERKRLRPKIALLGLVFAVANCDVAMIVMKWLALD